MRRQHGERLAEGESAGLVALDGRRVGHAPVGGDGWPGQTGQTSLAASSQTVNTKSISGAPGRANSSHDLLRRP